MTYDLTIIGGGPAGCAAAVYAARKRIPTLLISKEWGGQSIVSDNIQNWIGTISISGEDFAKSLRAHVEAYAGDFLTIKTGLGVTTIRKSDSIGYEIVLEDGSVELTKTVLIVAGSGRKRLQAIGADQYEHKGLTYCATCDGPLFADMDVAVVGGGNAGFESVGQLLAYCKSVTLLHHRDTFKADEITVEKLRQNPKLTILTNVEVTEVKGDGFVTGLVYKNKETGEETELPVSGIFVEIGQIPNTEFAGSVVKLDDYKKIVIDPMTQQTSEKGIWAAGDCTNILYHQNNIAAGDAVKAIEDIHVYLHTR